MRPENGVVPAHRIRETMKTHRGLFTEPMGGSGKTVEVDETYVGRKARTKAFLPVSEKQPVIAPCRAQHRTIVHMTDAFRANTLRRPSWPNISCSRAV